MERQNQDYLNYHKQLFAEQSRKFQLANYPFLKAQREALRSLPTPAQIALIKSEGEDFLCV